MSNSHGRQRPGLPPQNPPPYEGRQNDPRQPPRQARGQHDEPSLSWPPREPPPEPQSDWAHDAQGGYQNGQEWQPPPQGYAPPQGVNGHAGYQDQYGRPLPGHPHPQAAQPADPYRYPNEPEGVAEDPYAQPTLGIPDHRGYAAAPPARQAGSPYAARFEAYVPPSVAPEPNAGRQGVGSGYGAPQVEAQLRGSTHEDNWPSTAASQGGYARGGAAGYPQQQEYSQDPRYAPEQRYAQEPQAYGGGDQWGDPAGGGYAGPAQDQDPSTGWPQGHGGDAYGYPADPYGQPLDPALAAGSQNVAVNETYDEYDEEYEEEEAPPSGRKRLLMIVGALAGAIVVGAGLAYGYKTFSGGGSNVAGTPPIVRGDVQSSKALPDNPGGRQFEHTDSQVMRRISQEGRASAPADASGTRRVSTMMIGRDGRVVEPDQPSLPGAAPAQPVVSVPGLTVVDGFAGQRAARQALAPSGGGGPIVVTPPKKTANALSPVRPVSVTQDPQNAPPVVTAPPKAPPVVAAVVTPPRVSPPAAKARPKPPVSAAPAPPAAPSSGGNGYVAVLASVPVSGTSRLEALKTFADIQQNYGNVLRNRTPDVREANLGAKGNYHRLMVGPPSSRESANELCKELKSAGYSSCWITSY